jgi:hypothetical protein
MTPLSPRVGQSGRDLPSLGSPIPPSVDRAELAAFLRHARAALAPAAAGLVDNGRRRTPGLRRQEVAELAGV